MDNFNDLKAIWLTAKTDALPNSAEVIGLIKKFRSQKLRKKIMLISAASILVALMVVVIFIYKSTMLSTRVGEVLVIIAGCMLAWTNIRSIKRFYILKDYNNKDFIAFLEKTRQNQIYYYKKTQVIAMFLCSAGFLLYLYELVYQNVNLFLVVYTLAIIYLLILWFVVRPRVFKKEEKKLNATIERLCKISGQLKNIDNEI